MKLTKVQKEVLRVLDQYDCPIRMYLPPRDFVKRAFFGHPAPMKSVRASTVDVLVKAGYIYQSEKDNIYRTWEGSYKITNKGKEIVKDNFGE